MLIRHWISGSVSDSAICHWLNPKIDKPTQVSEDLSPALSRFSGDAPDI